MIEDDLAVLQDRLGNLHSLLAEAEGELVAAEENLLANSGEPEEDVKEWNNRMIKIFNRCEELHHEIEEVKYSIWQLENGDEEENGKFLFG